MKDFNSKVVVITGAGSGIGKALAINFAKRGANLALNDNKIERLEEVKAEIKNEGDNHVMLSAFDVSDWEAMQQFAREVIDRFGHVDVMINNAGVALSAYTVAETEIEDFKWVMDINFWGMVYGSKAFLPHLIERTEGCLVNISSILGIGAISKQAPYCASKFGIRGFTESLRMEAKLEFPHVSVISVHPGGIKTNIARDSRYDANKMTVEEHVNMTSQFEQSFINSPDYAAQTIIKGIQKKKSKVLIGNDAKRLNALVRLFPVRYTSIFIRELVKKYDPQYSGD